MTGKKGPRPKGEYADKSSVISTNISRELRQRLVAAVAESGLSLSREVEHRLRRSFQEDDTVAKSFGSERTFGMMRLLGALVSVIRRDDRPDADWLDDPWLFEQACAAIGNLLEQFAPDGEVFAPPKSELSDNPTANTWLNHTRLSLELPIGLANAIGNARDALPLQVGDDLDHQLSSLKDRLRSVSDRPLKRVPHLPEDET